MTLLTEMIGYLAIATGFFAITKKEMTAFRWWHLISSFLYIIYGIVLQSIPLILSGIGFCMIHLYELRKMKRKDKEVPQVL